MATSEQTVTRQDLLDRATALLPTLAERAAETEELRQILAATVDDLREAGLLRIAPPARYGGHGTEIDLMYEVAMILGRACGSTAWCFSVWSIHNWMLGLWPEEAQDEYFANGPDVLASSAFAPSGKLEPVPGGFRLSGRWQFSSGSDAGSWALLNAMTSEGPRMTIVPREDYEIVDTWFVSGLRGTGSKDIVVDGAFVPAHRISTLLVAPRMEDAHALHQRDSYYVPPMVLLPYSLCSPLVGMAQGALDEFVSHLKGRTGPGRTSESVALQLRLAEASAEIDAARMLVRTTSRELIERAADGPVVGEMDFHTARRTHGFVARLALQATNRLFEASGGHALFTSQPMQRFHRDAHAGSHQVALYWDSIAEGYARAVLGLPGVDPLNPSAARRQQQYEQLQQQQQQPS